MSTSLRASVRGLALLAGLLLVGCGPEPITGPLPTHPVKGMVRLAGKPLAGAQVTFHPADESKMGANVVRPTGQTDAEGRYQLTSYSNGDGAPVGSYLVSIVGVARDMNEAGGLFNDPKRSIAKVDPTKGKYVDPKKSGLKAEVKEGPNEVATFELK